MGFLQRELDARRYARAVEKSKGLDKVRLLVRDMGLHYRGSLNRKHNDSDMLFFEMNLYQAQALLCDIFYGIMIENNRAMQIDDKTYDDFAQKIERDYRANVLLGALWYGAVLGVFICKIANEYGGPINMDKIEDYIKHGQLEEDINYQIIDGARYTIEHICGEIPIDGAREIGALAQLCVGITPQKGHYADPFIFGGPMKQACLQTFETINIGSSDARALEKINFIH